MRIVFARESGIVIRSSADVSAAVGECLGAGGLILTETDLGPEFFDLRSGLAGELFQKLVNYRIRCAIVLPDPAVFGERFSELAREHSSHSMVRFVATEGDARAWLEKPTP